MITRMLNLGEYFSQNDKIFDIHVESDTQYVLYLQKDAKLSLNKDNIKINLNFIFNKENIRSQILFVYRLNKGLKLSLSTLSHHMVPNTSCDVYIKGVLEDNTYSQYNGKIIIEKKASNTRSFLNDKVLVLGDNIRNISKPVLEIKNNDVKASHGATTGRVSKDQLIYLQSRGLSLKESSDLIIEGFMEEIVSKINDPKVREIVFNSL